MKEVSLLPLLPLFAAVAPAPPDVEVAFTAFPPPVVAPPPAFEELPDDEELALPALAPRKERYGRGTATAAGVTFAAVSGILVGAMASDARTSLAGGCRPGRTCLTR